MSKILGIECAGASLSVAVLENEKTLAFELITAPSGYPEILVPTVQKVIEKAGGYLIKETDERWYFKF